MRQMFRTDHGAALHPFYDSERMSTANAASTLFRHTATTGGVPGAPEETLACEMGIMAVRNLFVGQHHLQTADPQHLLIEDTENFSC